VNQDDLRPPPSFFEGEPWDFDGRELRLSNTYDMVVHPALDFHVPTKSPITIARLPLSNGDAFFVVDGYGHAVPLEAIHEIDLKAYGGFAPTFVKGLTRDGLLRYLYKAELDPPKVFRSLRNYFEQFVDLEEEALDLVSIWTLGTYFYLLFPFYPYLNIVGVRGSGKSKLLSIIANLAHNGVASANLRAASLFRLVDQARGTLCLDEAESLSDTRLEDLSSILNAGFRKGAMVYRVEGEKTREVKAYDAYGPKAIVGIRGLNDVLRDRCITITMLRTTKIEKAASEPQSNADAESLRDDLYILYLQKATNVYHALRGASTFPTNPTIPTTPSVAYRASRLFMPLEVLSDTLGIRLDFNVAKERNVVETLETIEESIELQVLRALEGKSDVWIGTADLNLPYKGGTIGRTMKRLGFHIARNKGGRREWFITREAVQDRLRRFSTFRMDHEVQDF